ncbi:40S ribosomal protein S2 [Cricetulus griseus]|nr:40S ribosomal protein S2 [Cricetulus griseus]
MAASTEALAVVSGAMVMVEVKRSRSRPSHGGKAEDKEWIPVTKLSPLIKDKKIKSPEEIYLVSLPIKESEIIDFFLGTSLKDEVLEIMPVQKQTRAGQRTRFMVLSLFFGKVYVFKLSLCIVTLDFTGVTFGPGEREMSSSSALD